MKIKQGLKAIDAFGCEFELQLAGKPKYKTVCGTFLTLGCVFLVVLSIFIFVSAYRNTEEPQVTVSLESTTVYPEMDIFTEGLAFGFTLYNGASFIPPEQFPKYLTILGFKTIINYDESSQTPQIQTIPIYFRKWNQLTIEDKSLVERTLTLPSADEYKEIMVFPDADKTIWKVRGSFAQPPFETIKLFLFPCTLPNSADCATPQELSGVTIGMPFVSKSLHFQSKKDPIRTNLDTDTDMLVSVASRSYQIIFMKQNVVVDDDRDFYDPEPNYRFLDIEKVLSTSGIRAPVSICTPVQLLQNQCSPYIEIELKAGGKISTVHRKYEKLFATVSEIGGFGDLIFIVFGFVYMFYNQFFYNRWIRQQMIPEELRKNSDFSYLSEKDQKELTARAIETIMQEETDAVQMVKRFQKISILFEAIFEPHHLKLLPEVLLQTAKKEQTDGFDFVRSTTVVERDMSYEEAMNKLRNATPNNEVTQKLNEFFLMHLDGGNQTKLNNNLGGVIALDEDKGGNVVVLDGEVDGKKAAGVGPSNVRPNQVMPMNVAQQRVQELKKSGTKMSYSQVSQNGGGPAVI